MEDTFFSQPTNVGFIYEKALTALISYEKNGLIVRRLSGIQDESVQKECTKYQENQQASLQIAKRTFNKLNDMLANNKTSFRCEALICKSEMLDPVFLNQENMPLEHYHAYSLIRARLADFEGHYNYLVKFKDSRDPDIQLKVDQCLDSQRTCLNVIMKSLDKIDPDYKPSKICAIQ